MAPKRKTTTPTPASPVKRVTRSSTKPTAAPAAPAPLKKEPAVAAKKAGSKKPAAKKTSAASAKATTTPSTGFGFGCPPVASFQVPTNTSSGFGSGNVNPPATTSTFGSPFAAFVPSQASGGATPAFGSAAPTFGSAAPAFGSAAPAFGSGFNFGAPVVPLASPATTPAFGSSGGFGAPAVPTVSPVASAGKVAQTVSSTKVAATKPAGRHLDEVYRRRNAFGSSSHSVVGDYDVMLNQVAISASTSKNKFYRIQLIQQGPNVWNVFSRWGRVGEGGDHRLWGPWYSLEQAEKCFCQKFKDKSKNTWADRAAFVPKKGAYEMVELDEKAAAAADAAPKVIGDDSVPSQLALPTQKLIQMIFDKDMFKNELVRMNLDPKRMPLGTLSINQIQKGVAVLDSIRDALDAGQTASTIFQTLSAKFYTIIPHAYSRSTIPPVLKTPEQLEAKYEMLSTLHDIVVAQDVEKALGEGGPVAKNSLDLKYTELKSDLDLVTPEDAMHEVITQYITNTRHNGGKLDVQNIWAVRRSPEDGTFSEFASTPNHRLLWHGTNVAVVAAILKSGLRIMPSSGGRVGKGIYLANMLEKSQGYVRSTHVDGENIGCLFLVEAALGKMHEIHQDNSRLTKAPAGFDSVLAKGTLHPNPDEDRIVQLDGHDVRVNVGRPVTLENVHSSFHHDEYLVYQESQQRLRYVITFKM